MTQDKQSRTHQPGWTSGTSQRSPEVLASPVLRFDLREELGKLRAEDTYVHGERNACTLVKEPDFRVVLVALKPGGRLEEHRAPGRLSIQTLEGGVRLGVLEHRVELAQGGMLALEAGIPHDVEAIEESALLLTIVWAGRRRTPADKGGDE